MSEKSDVMGEPKDSRSGENFRLTKLLPGYFIVIASLIHLSGYFITNRFLSQLGLQHIYTGFWEIRYLQIGLIFTSIPFSLCCFGAIFYLFKNKNWDQFSRWQKIGLIATTYSAAFLLLSVVWVWPIFTARHTECANKIPVAFTCILIVTMIFGSTGTMKKILSYPSDIIRIRMLFLIPIFALAIFYFNVPKNLLLLKPLWMQSQLKDYIILTAIISCLLLFTYRYRKRIEDETTGVAEKAKKKRALWVAVLCILIPYYFFSIIAYADSIFLYIPVSMGGADYSSSGLVEVFMKNPISITSENEKFLVVEKQTPVCSKNKECSIPCVALKTKRLAIIFKTSEEIILADFNDINEWRKDNEKKFGTFLVCPDEISTVVNHPPKR